MNVGVIGSGFMGGTHARAYTKLPDVRVVAVSSRSAAKAEKLAQEVGAKPTTDDTAILNDRSIEAVSITLPTHLHKAAALAALQAGKHVLLEKPFALNVADCDEMIEAQRKSGKLLMIAHVLRFWPEYATLVNLVKSGALGKPLSAVATRLSQMPAWSDWFGDPAQSGGAVIDLMIHDLDALNWVFGQPKSIYARGHQARPDLWNHILTLVDYGDAQGSIEGSEFLPEGYPFTMALKVLCERGTVEYTFRAGGVSVEMGGGSTLTAYEPGRAFQPEAAGPGGDAYEAQIAYFVGCVRDGRMPEIGAPDQARLAVQMANAGRQSLESGNVVWLDSQAT
jgi:predicted dehydrogenase